MTDGGEGSTPVVDHRALAIQAFNHAIEGMERETNPAGVRDHQIYLQGMAQMLFASQLVDRAAYQVHVDAVTHSVVGRLAAIEQASASCENSTTSPI